MLVGSMVTVGSTRAAIVYYTTTRTEFAGTRRPRHLIHVDEVRARDLGQAKAFDIDVARLALLPVTAAYFPELTVGAVPTHGSDVTVVDVVERRLIELRASGTAIEPVRCVPAPSRSPGR